MNLLLTRYYGDANITKSKLTISIGDNTLMECEAREFAYRDYTEIFPQCSFHCLPTGVYHCVISSHEDNPSCLRILDAPGHRGAKMYIDARHEKKAKDVLLGFANPNVAPKNRRLERLEEARTQFLGVLYRHWGEQYTLTIDNSQCEVHNV